MIARSDIIGDTQLFSKQGLTFFSSTLIRSGQDSAFDERADLR